uniref:Uncharacterized protein n=1 Tax=Anguilla anguilla TaxID=7936 RepID=A0A0E9R3Q4_ANGAN
MYSTVHLNCIKVLNAEYSIQNIA